MESAARHPGFMAQAAQYPDNGRMSTSPTADKAKLRRPRLPGYLHVSDIQGLAQVATQGTLGVAGLAETVQGNVYKAVAALFGPLGARFIDRTPGRSGVNAMGLTGLVYGSVRGVTRLAGGAANALLARAVPLVGEQASSPQREAMLAALNGVLGDHLLATANPLAIRMSFRHEGKSLPLEKAALAQRLPGATAKLLVLIHGLCMNDLQWRPGIYWGQTPIFLRRHASHPKGQPLAEKIWALTPKNPSGHGELLAQELGYTPVYLHYNSGLHVSDNGRQLAELLEQLLRAWPQPVQELTLLTHSIGRAGGAQRLSAGRPGGSRLASAAQAAGVSGHAAPRRATGARGKLGQWRAGQQHRDAALCQNRPDPQRRDYRPALWQCAGGRLEGL